MEYTGERCLPGIKGLELLELEHRARYELVKRVVKNKRVLDLGSGSGYGAALLGEAAACVQGVDISEEAVGYATENFGSNNISYMIGNICDAALVDELRKLHAEPFDVVTCFEVVEHINNPSRLLVSAQELLSPNGVLFISTPNIDYPSDAAHINPHHVHEYTLPEFTALLKRQFKNVTISGQQIHLLSTIGFSKTKKAHFEEWRNSVPAMPKYFIAACTDRGQKLPDLFTALITGDAYLNLIQDKLNSLRQDQSFKGQRIAILERHISDGIGTAPHKLEEKNEKLEQALNALQEQLGNLNHERDLLTGQIQLAEQKLVWSQEQTEAAKAECESLRTRLVAAKEESGKERAAHDAVVQEFVQTKSEISAQLSSLSSQLASMEQERERLQAENAAILENRRALEGRLSEVDGQMKVLESENSELALRHAGFMDELDRSSSERGRLEAAVKRFEAENEGLEAENKRLEAESKRLEAVERDREQLIQANAALASRLEASECAREELSASAEELADKNDALSSELDATRAENSQLALDAVELRADVEKLREEHTVMARDFSSLTEAYDEAGQELARAEAALKETSDDRDAMREYQMRLEQEMEAQLRACEQRIDELTAALRDFQTERHKLWDSVNAARTQSDTGTRELAALKRRQAELAEWNQRAVGQIAGLTNSRDAQEVSHRALSSRINTLTGNLEETRKKIIAVEKAQGKLRADMKADLKALKEHPALRRLLRFGFPGLKLLGLFGLGYKRRLASSSGAPAPKTLVQKAEPSGPSKETQPEIALKARQEATSSPPADTKVTVIAAEPAPPPAYQDMLKGLDAQTGQLDRRILSEKETQVLRDELIRRPQQDLVSIVMPTFNRAHVIRNAIESALCQSYTNFELLIVDDGSDDGTKQIADEFRAKDPRVRFTPINHQGVCVARDTGLRQAQGKVIAYLDSDNSWHPDYLLFMVNALQDSGRNCAYSAIHVVDLENEENTHYRHRCFDYSRLVKNNYIDINVFVHRSALFEQLGGFDRCLRRWVDWDLILRYVRHHPPAEVPVALCEYIRAKKFKQISTEESDSYKFKVQNKHLVQWHRLEKEAPQRTKGLASIIIPVYDDVDLTRQCLASIAADKLAVPHEVIVVDNGSEPAFAAALRALCAEYQDAKYVRNYENYGFALGNNLGVAESKGEYLVLLNNDTEVTEGWLSTLIAPLKEYKAIGIVGPKLLYSDGTIQAAGMVFSEKSKIPYHIYRNAPGDAPQVNKHREFQVLTGACMGVRATDYISLRGFDPIFLNGCEDLDFCFRMRNILNKRIIYVPRATVYHHEGKTKGRSKHIMFNRKTFIRMWGTKVRPDDHYYYQEDGFKVDGYTKPGSEPDGDSAIYMPQFRKHGAPRSVPVIVPVKAEVRVLNVGFSSMWYVRGIALHCLQLAQALESDNIKTHIFARWESEKFCNEGAIYHPRVHNAGDDPTAADIVSWARERKIDLMIFEEAHPKDWKRVQALKEAGVKVMCYEDLDILRLEHWDRYGIFDAFLFNAFYSRDIMLDKFPGHSGLMLPWGTHPPEKWNVRRLEANEPMKFVHVAGWGGLNNRKNSDILLRAFDAASPQNAELHFYTQAPVSNYGDECVRIVKQNRAIRMHEGTIPNILDAYDGMDMLLWPSKREGLGLPIVESLVCGVPVLISDGYLMKEWIIPGDHGVLCPAMPNPGMMFLPELDVNQDELGFKILEVAEDRDALNFYKENVRKDHDIWVWSWQKKVFREQVRKFIEEPGYVFPDDMNYLPENVKAFQHRKQLAIH